VTRAKPIFEGNPRAVRHKACDLSCRGLRCGLADSVVLGHVLPDGCSVPAGPAPLALWMSTAAKDKLNLDNLRFLGLSRINNLLKAHS